MKDNTLAVLEEIKVLTGLAEFKRLMMQKAIYMDQVPDHYFFVGNPGTGKSEAICVMGKVFHELGLLAKGHVITCKQADLIGESVETTVQKTRMVCEKALDGVLEVDDVHNFVQYDGNGRAYLSAFANAAIDELITFMEHNRQRVSVVFTGYPEKTKDFFDLRPGIDHHYAVVRFTDYSPEELFQLLKQFAQKKDERISFSEEFSEAIQQVIGTLKESFDTPFGNAGTIRKLLNDCLNRAAARYLEKKDEDRKYILLPEDIPPEFQTKEK